MSRNFPLHMYFLIISYLSSNTVKENERGARIVVVDDEMKALDLEWTVGGAFQVDATHVSLRLYHLPPSPFSPSPVVPSIVSSHPLGSSIVLFQLVWGVWPENADAGSLSTKDWEGLVANAADDGGSLPLGAGLARWGGQDATTFSGKVDFEVFGNGWGATHSDGGRFAMFIVAIAEVDQSWANQSLKPSPNVGPQVGFNTNECLVM